MPKYSKLDYVRLMRPMPENWPTDKYGIPFIKKKEIDISNLNNGKWLINIENTSSNDINASKKIVHSFKFDDVLERYYKQPYKFLERTCKYYAVCTFDFSMHKEMKEAQIIEATFKNRWIGVWFQNNGINNVIVTVGWVDEKTYDICFSGIEDGTVLMISTIGVCNDESIELFLNGYKEMRKRFPNSKIICVGNKIPGMDDDICYIKYKETFGNKDKYNEYWQPNIFNWDDYEINEDIV